MNTLFLIISMMSTMIYIIKANKITNDLQLEKSGLEKWRLVQGFFKFETMCIKIQDHNIFTYVKIVSGETILLKQELITFIAAGIMTSYITFILICIMYKQWAAWHDFHTFVKEGNKLPGLRRLDPLFGLHPHEQEFFSAHVW